MTQRKRVLLIILGVLAVLLALVAVLAKVLIRPVLRTGDNADLREYEYYEPQRMTLEGTLVCLPHAPGYPPTEECAVGLRVDDGTHYVFDTMLMSSIPEEHRVGDRVTGNGVFTPKGRPSTDQWRKYDIEGIFSVTDGFRVVR